MMRGLGIEDPNREFSLDVLCKVGGYDINHCWEEVTAMSEPS
jgi:hypothetical protein